MSTVNPIRPRGQRGRSLAHALAAERRALATGSRTGWWGRAEDESPDLRNPSERHRTFDRMVRSDPNIAEALYGVTLPLSVRATWRLCVPFPPVNAKSLTAEEQQDQDRVDLISANLYGTVTRKFGRSYWCETPWSHRLNGILRFLRHGFAVFEKEWATVNNQQVLRRIVYLAPETIDRFEWRGSTLVGVVRSYQLPDGNWRSGELTPVENLALYGWDVVGTDIEGASLLRPLFGAWKRKDLLQKFIMLAAQRGLVGVPFATYEDLSEKQEEDLEQFLESSLGSGLENSYLLANDPNLKLGYMVQDTSGVAGLLSLAQREDTQIAHGGASKQQMLGESPNGSRAVGEVQQQLQYLLATCVAAWICEQEQRSIGNVRGLIEELYTVNFGQAEALPYLECNGIDPTEATRNLPQLLDGVKVGLIPKHREVSRMFSDRLGFDFSEEVWDEMEAQREAAKARSNVDPNQPPKPGDAAPPGGADPPEDKPAAPGEEDPYLAQRRRSTRRDISLMRIDTMLTGSASSAMSKRLGLASAMQLPSAAYDKREGTYGRTPTQFESQFLTLGAIASETNEANQRLTAALRAANREMIADIVSRVRTGTLNASTVQGFRRSGPKLPKSLTRRVIDIYKEVASDGRRQAEGELARQKEYAQSKQLGLERIALKSEGGAIPPGAPLIPKRVSPSSLQGVADPLQAVMSEVGEEAMLYAQHSIDRVWGRLVNEAASQLLTLRSSGLEGDALSDALESFLQDLSEKPIDLVGRELATVAYNQGRDVTAKIAAIEGQAGYAIRSEVLDDRTCTPCSRLDGTTYEIGSDDYERFMPPNECDGGERCRGFYVVLDNDYLTALEGDQ